VVLLMKQLVAVIDKRTTIVCLNAAGQIRRVDSPFSTLNGDFQAPPFHVHCRSIVVPYLVGTVNSQRADANVELQQRPLKKRDPRKMRMPPKPRAPKRLVPSKRARRPRKRP
jgi:hypothetical protein